MHLNKLLWIATENGNNKLQWKNAPSILQCHCCQKKPWHTSTLLSTTFGIFILKSLKCFYSFYKQKLFSLRLKAQNLMMMMMIMKMIHCYNLLWYIKGPRLLWIYFLLYQHQCTQNTLKLQETSVFNFLEIVCLMVSHQILNLTRHTLFQNMLPYKILLCHHPERPINIHNLQL
jgi:hypothetical protein